MCLFSRLLICPYHFNLLTDLLTRLILIPLFSGSRARAAGSDDQLSTEVDHGRGRGDDGTPEHVATQPARTGATNQGDELAAVRHQQHQETTDDPTAKETTHRRYGGL